jgi:glutathione S-transferase
MLKLYGGAQSRASITRWYLEELGVPYEFVQMDMQAGEHLQPDFLAINPMGKVPAIADESGFKLWESGAILLYLAEKHGQLPSNPEQKAEVYQWVLFANSTLGQGIFNESSREREMPRLLNPLNQHFKEHPYVLGQNFSVADVAVGSVLAYIPIMLKVDLSDYPEVVNYTQRLTQRPGFRKAMGGRP